MVSIWLRGDAIDAVASGRAGTIACICYLICHWIMMKRRIGLLRAVFSISWRMILISSWRDIEQISALLIGEELEV